MKKLSVLCVVLSFVILSCKKDTVVTNTPVACNLDTNSIIGSWKLTSVIQHGSVNTIPPSPTPLFDTSYEVLSDTSIFPSCQTDDLFLLNHGGNFSYNDAGTSCTPSGSFNNGTWALSSSNLVLNSDTFQVSHYECSKLITTSPTYSQDTTVMGFTYRIQFYLTSTYLKQ